MSQQSQDAVEQFIKRQTIKDKALLRKYQKSSKACRILREMGRGLLDSLRSHPRWENDFQQIFQD